jgi:hypothetical protein
MPMLSEALAAAMGVYGGLWGFRLLVMGSETASRCSGERPADCSS